MIKQPDARFKYNKYSNNELELREGIFSTAGYLLLSPFLQGTNCGGWKDSFEQIFIQNQSYQLHEDH